MFNLFNLSTDVKTFDLTYLFHSITPVNFLSCQIFKFIFWSNFYFALRRSQVLDELKYRTDEKEQIGHEHQGVIEMQRSSKPSPTSRIRSTEDEVCSATRLTQTLVGREHLNFREQVYRVAK